VQLQKSRGDEDWLSAMRGSCERGTRGALLEKGLQRTSMSGSSRKRGISREGLLKRMGSSGGGVEQGQCEVSETVF